MNYLLATTAHFRHFFLNDFTGGEKMSFKNSVFSFVGVLALAGCAAPESENVTQLTVDFSWQNVSRCTTTPPTFQIGGIPSTTKTLTFSMMDLNVPTFQHGGGRITYSGSSSVPAGAFSYRGPCPPAGSTHRYEFTVNALDADGRVVARGKAMRQFPAQ